MYFPRVVPHARGRSARLAVISLVCLLLLISELAVPSSSQRRPSIYEYTEGRTSPWPEQGNETESAPQGLDEAAYLRYLAQTYGLSNDLTWYARRIRPSMSSSLSSRGRASVTEIDRKFVATQLMRARVTDDRLRLETEKSISLPVPRSPLDAEIDASSLLFGISTTYSRLVYANHSLVRDWERWLTDGRRGSNGAGLVLTLHKASGEDVERASRALHAVGIDAVVQQSADHSDSATRYVELVRLLRSHAESTSDAKGPNKKYLALLDDDVFLPSMSRLIQRLSQFDPAREYYIGAPSERSDWAVERGTTITSGGGAVFLTLPMAERVVQLPCLGGGADQDRDQPPRGVAHWDLSLYRCITTHTDVSLQVLPSYYSPDDDDGGGEGEEGDSSGSSSSLGSGPNNEGYGSGMQPLTLHHYKNWHRFEAGAGHLVASACGEACFLQRFRFQDDWILVNGFALSQYPDGAEAVPVREKKTKKKKKRPETKQGGDDSSQKTLEADKKNGKEGPSLPKEKKQQDNEENRDPEKRPKTRLNAGDRKADKQGAAAARTPQPDTSPAPIGPRLVVHEPDRPRDPRVVAWRGRRRTWRLLDAREVPSPGEGRDGKEGGGEVWQAYVKRRGGGNWVGDIEEDPLAVLAPKKGGGGMVHYGEEKSDVDSVIVLIWERP